MPEDRQVGVMTVPHPVFRIVYEKKNITQDITPYVRAVTYSDYLSGQSDEIEVELEDADGRWVRNWYPGKGDILSLSLGYSDAPLLPCGAFEIDEIEFAQPPSTVSIRGLATGIKKSLRTRLGRAYENTTLDAIAERIAKRNKLTLTGKIRPIPIDRVTQYQERDVAFLTRLARDYGYAFKIRDSRMVFTELADLRDDLSVATLTVNALISLRMRDKIKDVYPEAKGRYHDPKTKKLLVYGVKDDQVSVTGQSTAASGKSASGDTLKLSQRGSPASVQAKTKAALDAANLERTSGSLSLVGNPRLVAGSTFELTGCGKLSGKYWVESARHRLDRSGYLTELEIKRVAPRSGKAAPAQKAPGGLKVYGMKDGKVQVVGSSQDTGKR